MKHVHFIAVAAWICTAACVDTSEHISDWLVSLTLSDEEIADAPRPKEPRQKEPRQKRPSCVTAVDIGNGFGGNSATPRDINERGQVVGIGFRRDRSAHAFIWNGGAMLDLGTLGGRQSDALALNDRGEAVGYAQRDGDTASSHATLWRDGVIVDLGTLGGESSAASDIDDSGRVVGSAETSSGQTHAFLWDGGVMKDLGTLGGEFSRATRINDRGQIVGHSTLPGEDKTHAFLWESGVMTDLGPLSGRSHAVDVDASGDVLLDTGRTAHLLRKGTLTEIAPFDDAITVVATDLNDRGQVVGSASRDDGRDHAFLWHDGATTPIAPPDPSAYVTALAINRHGQVVGFAAGTTGGRAFSWIDGELTYLASEDENTVAFAINDRGQIIGNSDGVAKLWETDRCKGGRGDERDGEAARGSGER